MAGTKPTSLTAAELAALKAEYESGLSALAALAARFSLSPRALNELARRLNFAARPPARPFQRRDAGPPAGASARCAAGPPDAPTEPASGAASAAPRRRRAPPGVDARAKSASAPKPTKPRAARSPAAAPKPRRPAPSRPRAKPGKPLDIDALAERLRLAAERELTEIHDRLEAGEDVERRARALASLVKTLADLARLAESRGGSAAPDESGEWSLDDLRSELARRLDRLAPQGDVE